MQTFIPTTDNKLNARLLDRQRLGKQRIECQQILQTLLGDRDGWRNHPAVKMWRGHEGALCYYALDMIYEWRGRGYKDTREPIILALRDRCSPQSFDMPEWWGRPDVHESHTARLLHKSFDHYVTALRIPPTVGRRMMAEYDDYVWPVE